jgi:hypothetical protein
MAVFLSADDGEGAARLTCAYSASTANAANLRTSRRRASRGPSEDLVDRVDRSFGEPVGARYRQKAIQECVLRVRGLEAGRGPKVVGRRVDTLAAVILSTDGRLTLPPILVEPAPQSPPKEPETLEGVERAFIARVLEEANWMIGGPRGAAARLGLKRTTLHSLLKRLGLSRPRDAGGADFDAPRSYYRPGRMRGENWAAG